MGTFKVPNFESNTIGDAACHELFNKSVTKNKSVVAGKVAKKIKKNKKCQKIKTAIQNQTDANVTITRVKDQQETLNSPLHSVQRGKNISHTSFSNPKKNINKKIVLEKSKKLQKRKRTEDISARKTNVPTLFIKKNPEKTKTKLQNKIGIPKQQDKNTDEAMSEKKTITNDKVNYKQKKKEKLKEKLLQTINTHSSSVKRNSKVKSLRERMMEKLQAARFRYINEQIYSSNSKEAQKLFNKDPDSFRAYHEGYKQQVNKWPLNPLDVIIESIQKMPTSYIIADFGCGDAKLASNVKQKVHSFDLVSTNDSVIACDMAHVPLRKNSVDVVVFCLSLMGTNLHDYFLEANRVLKDGGTLKIAEVESRFQDVQKFIEELNKFHFKNTWKDLSHNLFHFLDFKKECNIKNKKKLPTISLNPCLYKKR